MTHVDSIIVGQGISGTIMAFKLIQEGKTIKIIDNNHQNSSSTAAAGIINPITGRSYVKSWLIDRLLPVAIDTYRQLEEILDIKILNQRSVIRTLEDIKSENNWLGRTVELGYQDYLKEAELPENYHTHFVESLSYGEIINAFQVSLLALLNRFKEYYQNLIRTEEFDFSSLALNENGIQYKDLKSKSIIFCEGYRAIDNPFFKYLDFRPAKGEALIIKISDYNILKNIRHKLYVVPFGEDTYWVGAGYQKDFKDENPSDDEFLRLEEQLKSFLKTDFKIVDHIAGVRPATKHRKPFVGRHKDHPDIYILNGMGAKGSSLVPYFSEALIKIIKGELNVSENGLMNFNS